jgi:hypothetical protein
MPSQRSRASRRSLFWAGRAEAPWAPPLGRVAVRSGSCAGRRPGARGAVLRCAIDDGGPGGEPIIHIDGRELSWRGFGCLLKTYAGSGVRTVFVPDHDLDEEPRPDTRAGGAS